MTRQDLIHFIQDHPWAVEASVSDAGAPQAAVVGIVITEELHILFDTFEESRKCANLRQNPAIALVIGWDDAQTVQFEGIADEPTGAELEHLKEQYFARFPDGRDRDGLHGITYFRVRPTWIRYSDFRPDPAEIYEYVTGPEAG